LDTPEVLFEAGDDTAVAVDLVGRSALVGVVTEDGDVGELVGEGGSELVAGCEVVALFADVRVGAGSGGEVSAALAVGDAGLDHLAVQPVDAVGHELAGGAGDESSAVPGQQRP
jgi:hypothetical protein